MAFEASKKEWSELYAFFRILSDGKVAMGDSEGKDSGTFWKVAGIQREEHDGTRMYKIEGDKILISGDALSEDKRIDREDFGTVADLILDAVKHSPTDEVMSPDGVEEFLDEVAIFDLEAKTQDRTDFSVCFWDTDAPLIGFNVRSRLSLMNRLLDGGRAANLKFEKTGVKFAVPTVNKVNSTPETPNEVMERMMLIERLGGVLKYSDVADRVFRCNLSMIDLHFPRLLAEMVRSLHLDGISRTNELTEQLKVLNPLKIKDELITKHNFYEYKVKQFLMALALGMRPAKIFNGLDSAVEGLMFITGQGEVLCYHKSQKLVFEDFLYKNTRFEKGSLEKDKYGYLEKENGVYYFKLNAKIGFVKR